uniref:BZIP domain-containing protein n=1 Tax=Rhabditophanes sp. KR3021 TaxID=114890 RepID=A0AC35UD36_9BILA
MNGSYSVQANVRSQNNYTESPYMNTSDGNSPTSSSTIQIISQSNVAGPRHTANTILMSNNNSHPHGTHQMHHPNQHHHRQQQPEYIHHTHPIPTGKNFELNRSRIIKTVSGSIRVPPNQTKSNSQNPHLIRHSTHQNIQIVHHPKNARIVSNNNGHYIDHPHHHIHLPHPQTSMAPGTPTYISTTSGSHTPTGTYYIENGRHPDSPNMAGGEQHIFVSNSGAMPHHSTNHHHHHLPLRNNNNLKNGNGISRQQQQVHHPNNGGTIIVQRTSNQMPTNYNTNSGIQRMAPSYQCQSPTTSSHSISREEHCLEQDEVHYVEDGIMIPNAEADPGPANAPRKSVPKKERDEAKRARQAEAARQRYHNLSCEEKKQLNMKRTMAQKMKRQREKEVMELESILKKSNDIVEDPKVTEALREKRMRAKWAEAARLRYQRMNKEERKAHNMRRRMRQLAAVASKASNTLDPNEKEELLQKQIKEQNAKKAEAARLRYHRMTDEQKKAYNQRRTEAFRRRRHEEETLLSMPVGLIKPDNLDKAQQILARNQKRATQARLRYQKMSPEEKRAYNQKRYTPKTKRSKTNSLNDYNSTYSDSNSNFDESGSFEDEDIKTEHIPQNELDIAEEDPEILSTIEKDVIKRTHVAKQALLRQNQQTNQHQKVYSNRMLLDQGTPQIHGAIISHVTQAPHHTQQIILTNNPQPHLQTRLVPLQPGHLVQEGPESPDENGHALFQTMPGSTYSTNNNSANNSYYSTPTGPAYTIGSGMVAGGGNKYVAVMPNGLRHNDHHRIHSSIINHSNMKEEDDLPSEQHIDMLNGTTASTSHHIHHSTSQNDLFEYYTDSGGNSNHGLIKTEQDDEDIAFLNGHHQIHHQQRLPTIRPRPSPNNRPPTKPNQQLGKKTKMQLARDRYQKLSAAEEKALVVNELDSAHVEVQRSREEKELEQILRSTNDIQKDATQAEILKLKGRKGNGGQVSSAQQPVMAQIIQHQQHHSSHNDSSSGSSHTNPREKGVDPDSLRIQIVQANAKKAEAARQRYHKMNTDEKKCYNQRRTEAFRRRRMEEELLLSTPAGRISEDALAKAQQIMMRNAKRAELARLRYHKMSTDERKAYNQRRSNAKRKRSNSITNSSNPMSIASQEYNLSNDNMSLMEDQMYDDSHLKYEEASYSMGHDSNSMVNSSGLEHEMLGEDIGEEEVSKMEYQDEEDNCVIYEETLRELEEDVERKLKAANRVNAVKNGIEYGGVSKRDQRMEEDLVMDMDNVHEGDHSQHDNNLIHQGSHVMMHQQPIQVRSMMSNQISNDQASYSSLPPQVIFINQGQNFMGDPNSHQGQQLYVQHIDSNGTQILQSIDQTVQLIQMPDGQIVQQSLAVMPVRSSQHGYEHPNNIVLQQQQPHDNKQHLSRRGRNNGRREMYEEREMDDSMVVHNGHHMQVMEMKEDEDCEDTISPIINQVCSNDYMGNEVVRRRPPQPTEKVLAQRARRAARARQRYHDMSEEDRKKFNAKRAVALRKARQRDEELCQLYDAAQQTGALIDDKTMGEISEAQRRRSRRAEAARLKYQRMTVEERRSFNCLRDRQRRDRKKRLEEGGSHLEDKDSMALDDEDDMGDLMHEDMTLDEDQNETNPNDNMSIVYTQYEVYDNGLQGTWES